MGEFLDIQKDWLARKYLPLIGRRFWTFKIALNLLLQFGGADIVETGCIRKKDDYEAGMSTLIFAEYMARYGGTFTTIDINPAAIELCKEIIRPVNDKVAFIADDSVKALKAWDGPIDLLYLDSMDCDPKNDEITQKAQDHNLLELKTAWPNLARNSIILIDDNYFQNGGKSAKSKVFLAEHDCVCLLDYEQTLWLRVK